MIRLIRKRVAASCKMHNLRTKKGGFYAAFFNAHFFCVLLLLLCIITPTKAQKETVSILFYNVENLFDTIDNPSTFDDDFTPDGKLKYDAKRYQTKLNNIAGVFREASSNSGLSIIGLSEIENRQVLEALIQKMDGDNWGILHVDSPDGRGIDNAILFNRDKVVLHSYSLYSIDLGYDVRPTRDILFGDFSVIGKEERIGVFVNHWPSRYGGADESAWKRMIAAKTLVEAIKTEQNKTPTLNIVCLGDFNDHPNDKSLLAVADCDTGACLVNLSDQFLGKKMGTYVYRGEWGVLDQILVNQRLLNGLGDFHTSPKDASIFIKDFMLYTNSRSGEKFPNRTYGGAKYYGGYSDHLPVQLTVHVK